MMIVFESAMVSVAGEGLWASKAASLEGSGYNERKHVQDKRNNWNNWTEQLEQLEQLKT